MLRRFLVLLIVVMLLHTASCAMPPSQERHETALCSEVTVHAYAPPSAKAWTERPSPKQDYVAPEILLHLDRAMVEKATISAMKLEAAPEDRKRYQLPELTFVVAFALSDRGRKQLDLVRRDDTNTAYVGECGGHLFFAIPPRGSIPGEMDFFVDDSPRLAEQVARSLTDRVQFLRANRLMDKNPFLNEPSAQHGASNNTIERTGLRVGDFATVSAPAAHRARYAL